MNCATHYKFFGTHSGILYGKRELLESLVAYKVRPATNLLPGKFETGTQNHEGIAGVLGSVEYFEWLGKEFGGEFADGLLKAGYTGRRLELKKAMAALRSYEMDQNQVMLSALQAIPGLEIYGITDNGKLDQRVATFSFRMKDLSPRRIAEKLNEHGIYVWDGNYYAINVTERLGIEDKGGMVRVGAVHYNTLEEIEKLKEALLEIAGK